MASIRKLATGKWQAQVYVNGKRISKCFALKTEATYWANQQEIALRHSDNVKPQGTLTNLLEKYMREVTKRKKSKRTETHQINAFLRHPVAQVNIANLSVKHLVAWRDERACQISNSGVNRTLTIVKHALRIAHEEWEIIDVNIGRKVKLLPENPSRDRRISEEIERILYVGGYREGEIAQTATQRVTIAFLFAIETAMRAGEIRSLTWGSLNTKKRVARLYETKNGHPRDVPLSTRAIELLEKLPKDRPTCFDLKSGQLDALFRKIKDKAGIEDLHFHDTRHEAITRLASKLDVLSLARMVGHRDIRMLQVYYNETAEELAKKLD